jgi:hypothetical protein
LKISDVVEQPLEKETHSTKHWRVALAIGSVALGGCNSVIFEPFDADKGSLSMDARQRTILSVERGEPPGSHRIVCAEPSPDALATIAASAGVSGGISGIIPQLPGSADLAASFASGEQAAMIGARNSTIQLLRDGLYRACEAYMNGALGDFGYGLVLVNYGRVMVSLLTADGLAHPGLVKPVVIGSTPGNTTTSSKGSKSGSETKSEGSEAATASGRNRAGFRAGGRQRKSRGVGRGWRSCYRGSCRGANAATDTDQRSRRAHLRKCGLQARQSDGGPRR